VRTLLVLLALAATVLADDLDKNIWVVRIETERSTFSGTTRQTLAAPALPVGKDGLLLAVGFAIDPPTNDRDVVRVSAIDPEGKAVPAKLLGGATALSCTFFRLQKGPMPEVVRLAPVEVKAGDKLVLLGRHGPLMKFAARRIDVTVDAVARDPNALYAIKEPVHRWLGCIAMTEDGKLAGFVDTRQTMTKGGGMMLGVGAQTLVVVGAASFAQAASRPPEPRGEAPRSRAWIGVNLSPFDKDREAFFSVAGDMNGALVTGVAPGSPADKAGLRVHDVVRSIGPLAMRFEKQQDWDSMLRAVQLLPLNQPLPCKVVRFFPKADGSYGSKALEVMLTLEERPLDFRDAPETEVKDLGLKVKPLTQDMRRGASPARLSGTQPGDLILRVDEKTVKDVKSFVALLDEARKAKKSKIVFFVRRGSETLFLAVTTDWK